MLASFAQCGTSPKRASVHFTLLWSSSSTMGAAYPGYASAGYGCSGRSTPRFCVTQCCFLSVSSWYTCAHCAGAETDAFPWRACRLSSGPETLAGQALRPLPLSLSTGLPPLPGDVWSGATYFKKTASTRMRNTAKKQLPPRSADTDSTIQDPDATDCLPKLRTLEKKRRHGS